MSATFEKLKEMLKAKGALTNEEIAQVVAESGEMTAEEQTWIESERLELAKKNAETVTMDQYLEALKVLDNAAEGSDEYKKAEAIVERYENGS